MSYDSAKDIEKKKIELKKSDGSVYMQVRLVSYDGGENKISIERVVRSGETFKAFPVKRMAVREAVEVAAAIQDHFKDLD